MGSFRTVCIRQSFKIYLIRGRRIISRLIKSVYLICICGVRFKQSVNEFCSSCSYKLFTVSVNLITCYPHIIRGLLPYYVDRGCRYFRNSQTCNLCGRLNIIIIFYELVAEIFKKNCSIVLIFCYIKRAWLCNDQLIKLRTVTVHRHSLNVYSAI